MVAYGLLAAAIVSEVAGTLALRVAAHGRTSFYAIVVAGYVLAFGLLSVSLRHGMPLGVAYGIWSAAGVALTAVASRALFDEPLTRRMVMGIALIAAGVLLVEFGAAA
ncbi:cation/cationic drug transporter [Mycolicibacterium chubuense NBB4]|uniref:Cation/cationic drug transporter n=1 Tax=Mycolicibacterium chubuense (strain NBB4) TaxID=710421 RepID=I4BJ99_MYCCN|nr:SMR family transporter [Mycolicibacterium chubuense]AFM17356.1 cation/cationic drug transporter [Mycolicibacterium chubuense NBB4]